MAIVYIGDSQSFDYTGSIQEIPILFSGVYKLEVYGAKGGAGEAGETKGAAGGYSVGYKFLNKDDILYIAVGGAGQHTPDTYSSRAYGGWNGGGNAGTHYGGGGGGASHIATALYDDGQLKHYENYKDNVLIVAGGGGGSAQGRLAYEYEGTWHSFSVNALGGTGGGASGGIGTYVSNSTGSNTGSHNNGGQTSGTQTTAGSGGGFGYGGSTYGDMDSSAGRARGGGGGGWYGGSYGERINAGGGGGSGYIGNVPTFTYKDTEYASSTENGKRNGNGYVVITSIDVDIAYQITFETNGGYLAQPTAMFSPEATLPLPTPIKIGYMFMGWHRNADLSDEAMFELSAGETGNITLYAAWKLDVFEYNCTQSIQTFTAPHGGLYKLEVWGAQGGSNSNGGALGGYSVGYMHLDKGTELYVCVGGQGAGGCTNGQALAGGYNGGGSCPKIYSGGDNYSGAGGGATHIAKVSGLLKDLSKYKSTGEILIVAGGGGGKGKAGTGGGLTGGSATASTGYTAGKGGSQTAGGSGHKSGSFGKGGNADETYGVGAGGGGWYGGGGSSAYASGGGGSGYIGGVPTITYRDTSYSAETTNGVRSGDGLAIITPVAKDTLFIFDGVEVTDLIYNGVAITSLDFNGLTIF